MLLEEYDSTYKAQWNFTLAELNKIYSICKMNEIPVVLLIFPFTFQFNNKDIQWPQELLIQDAIKNQIAYIDFLKPFEDKINSDTTKIAKYFLDEDHFTPLGHKLVAEEISKLVLSLKNE